MKVGLVFVSICIQHISRSLSSRKSGIFVLLMRSFLIRIPTPPSPLFLFLHIHEYPLILGGGPPNFVSAIVAIHM